MILKWVFILAIAGLAFKIGRMVGQQEVFEAWTFEKELIALEKELRQLEAKGWEPEKENWEHEKALLKGLLNELREQGIDSSEESVNRKR